jgi:glycosyltransferase involved in cell wall biosynthesis
MRPEISVIITEYWPRGFIKYAIKSVLHQTLDRRLYEIVIVKRFKDQTLDKQIEERGGRIIYLEDAPIGYYLATGVKEAEGDIIAFLDDDDMYTRRKLEYVYKVFNSNDNIGYYHHLVLLIDSHNRFLGTWQENIKEFIIINPKRKEDVNKVLHEYQWRIASHMSSIVVRKQLIKYYLEHLQNVVTHQDYFMLFYALKSNYLMIHEPIYLSFYRVHGTQTALIHTSTHTGTEIVLRMARQALINLIGYYQLYSFFPMIKGTPFWRNLLAMFHYNLAGLLIAGLPRRYVIPVSIAMLQRSFEIKSINRLILGVIGLTYNILPRRLIQQFMLRYYLNKFKLYSSSQ